MDLWQATEVQRATWRVEVWETMLRVHREDYQIGIRRNTQRGKAVLWSKRSRISMLRYINSVAWDRWPSGWFITLTYPDSKHAYTHQLRTRQRSYFVLQLERQLSEKLPIIWRTEFEERQSGRLTGRIAPHHHMMVLTEKPVNGHMVKQLWRNCLEYQEGYLHTKTKKIYGAFGCAKYLAAYVGKHRDLAIGAYLNSPFEFGRQWGVLRPSLIPRQACESIDLTPEQKHRAAELGIVVGLGGGQGIPSGYTIFGREKVEKVLSGIFSD